MIGIALFIITTGCSATEKTYASEANPSIAVEDLKLLMTEDEVFEILGTDGEHAPCVYGYEYNYDEKGINVGFRNGKSTLRRITFRKGQGSIYGIALGDTIESAKDKLKKAGLQSDDTSDFTFYVEDIYVSLLSKEGTDVDGITIEIINDAILEEAF